MNEYFFEWIFWILFWIEFWIESFLGQIQWKNEFSKRIEQGYILTISSIGFWFWVFIRVNGPKKSLKYAILKICPKLARKLYSCETSVYSNIIGDRWRQKVVSVFKYGRQKSNFFAPKITKIGCFLVPKMGLWMPKSENGHHQSPTIPKIGGIDTCFT